MSASVDLRGALIICMCAFGLIGVASPAVTPDLPGRVEIEVERKVGYVIGDLIPYDVIITVDQSWTLRPSSLPGPGRPEYWLDLRSVDVEETRASAVRHYRLKLVYQIFYAPIEARKRTLPGFTLGFDHAGASSDIKVPALTITMSPLREVATGTGDPEGNLALAADRAPASPPLLAPLAAVAVAGASSLILLMVVAWKRALWPFARRRNTPFTQAERAMRRADPTDSKNYTAALLALHRAIDSTAGWHVFADDQQRFLLENPRFGAAGSDIAEFFAASRYRFFGDNPAKASTELAPVALLSLSKRLALLERRA